MKLICLVCLEGDDARKGDVERYANKEAGLVPGNYHRGCAAQVGYNEWDANG